MNGRLEREDLITEHHTIAVHPALGDSLLRALRSGIYESGGHEGHTSQSGVTGGRRQGNWELSGRRQEVQACTSTVGR